MFKLFGGIRQQALFVFMVTLEISTHPKLLANTAKALSFTQCSEANLYGIVDAQIDVVEAGLFGATVVS